MQAPARFVRRCNRLLKRFDLTYCTEAGVLQHVDGVRSQPSAVQHATVSPARLVLPAKWCATAAPPVARCAPDADAGAGIGGIAAGCRT